MKEIKRSGANGRRALSTEYNGIVYTSGITSTDLQGDITQQTQDVLAVIDNILSRHGTDKTNVLQGTITLSNMQDYASFNAVWQDWVIDGFEPTRSVTGGELALSEYKVKISVIAAVK